MVGDMRLFSFSGQVSLVDAEEYRDAFFCSANEYPVYEPEVEAGPCKRLDDNDEVKVAGDNIFFSVPPFLLREKIFFLSETDSIAPVVLSFNEKVT
jgi:hypothetical protein